MNKKTLIFCEFWCKFIVLGFRSYHCLLLHSKNEQNCFFKKYIYNQFSYSIRSLELTL